MMINVVRVSPYWEYTRRHIINNRQKLDNGEVAGCNIKHYLSHQLAFWQSMEDIWEVKNKIGKSQIIRLDHPLQGIKPKPVYFISDSCCCSSGSKATNGSFSWESKWKPREVEQLPLAGRWQLWWWQRRWRAGWWRPWRQARPRRPGKSGGFRIRWWK